MRNAGLNFAGDELPFLESLWRENNCCPGGLIGCIRTWAAVEAAWQAAWQSDVVLLTELRPALRDSGQEMANPACSCAGR